MYKTVLFDLDGTLLNTIDDLADSANRVCAAHGWPQYETAQYRYFVGNGIPKLVERFSPASCRSPEQLAATLAEFDKVYGAHMHDKTAPYPGMPALLARLKAAGVRMAVFSNKADEFARAVVARYFDADLFEVVRGALPDVPTKPAPEGTRALMAHLGVEADGSVLYVGDSNVDVETAHNAGLPCCGVLWGFRTREELTEAGAEYLALRTAVKIYAREGQGRAADRPYGWRKVRGQGCRGRRPRRPAEGSRPLPTMQTGKGDTMARLRAGHARPLRTAVNGSNYNIFHKKELLL